jgi:lipopolysaccharide biosynthesis protein
MTSICFFASHYRGKALPEYVSVYLSELNKYFNRTILFCENEPDESSLDFLRDKGIEWSLTKNEGYDFGKWYHAFKMFNISSFDTVGLVNDSCVLFSSLMPFWTWLGKQDAEVTGMTKSAFRGEHVQSYFMVLRGRAVGLAKNHFSDTGIVSKYDDVITKYELALSARFLREGLTMESFVDNGGYIGEFSPYYKCVEHHIQQGMPLIKKRILLADYRDPELFTLARMNFRISPAHYADLISSSFTHLLLDPFELVKLSGKNMNLFRRAGYEFTRLAIRAGRPLKHLIRFSRK